jgi:hypothetical protein
MPISYVIDQDLRLIRSRAEGVVSFADLSAHMRTELGSEFSTYPELFDCTQATTDLTAEQVRKLVQSRAEIAKHHKAAPVAIVATNDVLYGMLRMFDALTNELRPIRVFRDMRQAEEWLNSISD